MSRVKNKIAIVHDYFNQFGGAEKVVEQWLKVFPDAIIYTSLFIPKNFESSEELTKAWKEGRVKTTILQRFIGFFERFFKHFFWIYPIVMSFVTIKNYDKALISSTYCGKNVKFENVPKIIHYCHSPTRFLYGMITETDHDSLPSFFRIIIPFFNFFLRYLDLRAVKYLNKKGAIWIGNSPYIQKMIKKAYNVDAKIIFPPVEIEKFLKIERNPENDENKKFYYYFGRISFHKRINLIVKTCLKLKKKVIISGNSSSEYEMKSLKKIVELEISKNPELKDLVTFTGRISDQEIADYLSRCRAFLFPGKEDFGIAPIEALASGVPAIMYKKGGSLEYLKDQINGIFFENQTVESFTKGIRKFEEMENKFSFEIVKKTSLEFSAEQFNKKILNILS